MPSQVELIRLEEEAGGGFLMAAETPDGSSRVRYPEFGPLEVSRILVFWASTRYIFLPREICFLGMEVGA